MNVNIDKLGIFKDFQSQGNGDGIVNLRTGTGEGDGTSQLTINGEYYRINVFRGLRSQQVVDSNRNVRDALLKNLRETFGLQDDAGYMDKLKRMLGDDILKSEDFGLDAEGRVRASCPLTERRISAIVGRVKELASPAVTICRDAMTKKCVDEFVAGVKQGRFGIAGALTKFLAGHFGGGIGRRLEGALAVPGARRDVLCGQIAAEMLTALKPALIEGGVTWAQLKSVLGAMKASPGNASPTDTLYDELAASFLTKLEPEVVDDIAKRSWESRLACLRTKLDDVRSSEKQVDDVAGLMKYDHGRDILVRMAIDGIKNLGGYLPTAHRELDGMLQALAAQVKELGSVRAYLFVNAVCGMSSGKDCPGLMHMQQRQLLGTVLKQYTDLDDADLRQFGLDQLQYYARAAVDDSLAVDRETIIGEMKRYAESMRRQNYTDAETRELLEFARAQKDSAPVRGSAPVRTAVAEAPAVGQADPVPVADPVAVKAEKENRTICDNLTLLGRLFHREDVWTADALGGARAIMDTLAHNGELVKSLCDSWNVQVGSMSLLSGSVTVVLNTVLGFDDSFFRRFSGQGDGEFTNAIQKINEAIVSYAKAQDDQARLTFCQTIFDRVEALTKGLSQSLQGMLTSNLDKAFEGMGLGSAFKDLPPGQKPENADLLALAKSRHPVPKHETKAQRKQREAAILQEYSKLVVSPQAGGLGTLIRSLATNYVAELDTREKRAMLSGALQAVTPELLTKMLKGKSFFEVLKDVVRDASAKMVNRKSNDIGTHFGVMANGDMSEATQEMAGNVVGGLLKGAGPVFQKLVQMVGAEKLPPYLRKAVKECKSELKPIPMEYVEAKLAEVVRQSNGQILQFSNLRSIGAASIAQAFKCDLTDRFGKTRTVVIKMMRPDVRNRMEREIAAIKKSVAGAGEGALRTLNARISSLLGELDFTAERENIRNCQSIYGKSSFSCLHSVKLAEDCPQLPDVLVMELAPGKTFQSYMDETTDRLNGLLDGKVKTDKDGRYKLSVMKPADRQELEAKLVKMYRDVHKRQANLQRLMQVWLSNALFGDGRFHGDLHGGNVMVDENGQLTVIDFGNAPTFSETDRKSVVKMVVAAARGESKGVLDAVSTLVSPESRKCLTDNRRILQARLDAAFAVGGFTEAAERLTIVFGELARSGVEVPESLYNFVEAFGRVQQLSDSMTRTLDRISTVLPYVRDHQTEGGLDFKVGYSSLPGKAGGYASGKSMDALIDEMLMNRIEQMRKDEPFITDGEIFRRLQKESDNGGFDNLFSSNSVTLNPVMTAMNYGSFCFSDNDLAIFTNKKFLGELPTNEGEDFDAYLRYKQGQTEGDKAGYDRIMNKTRRYVEVAQGNIEKFFGPYCRQRPELRGSLDKLKGLMTKCFAPEYINECQMGCLEWEFTPAMLEQVQTRSEEEMIEYYLNNVLYDKNISAHQGRNADETKRGMAVAVVGVMRILCKEIYPAVVDSFKLRMREVAGRFNLDKFPPPVSINSTITSSILWHLPKAVGLGGSDMVGLFVKAGWSYLTDESVTIRANFNVPLARFRGFASMSDGRVHMTEGKQLESTASKKKHSVHNAEAWRALAESLMTDMKLTAEEFYRSATWMKIAAIFEFGEGENFFNVEKAGELTPTALQRILAVRDMDKLDRSQPSLQKITGYFTTEPNVEDTTFEQFNATLTSAFQEEFGVSVSGKLGIEAGKLDAFFKTNYGKVITRMSEIGAADPYRLMSGKPPRPQDLRRWLIAAVLEALKDEPSVTNRETLSLEAVFGSKIGVLRSKAGGLRIFPSGSRSGALTAVLLHAGWTTEDGLQDEAEALLQFCQKECEGLLEAGQLIRGNRGRQQGDRDVRAKSGLYSDVADADLKEELKAQAEALGFGMAEIAADEGLYRRYVGLESAQHGDFDKLLDDLAVRVRKSMYFLDMTAKLDEASEIQKILGIWATRRKGLQAVGGERAIPE